MLFFKNRTLAREFAKSGKQVVDLGVDAPKRWAVKVL